MLVLEYKKWQKFNNVIETANISCKNSNYTIDYYFIQEGKMVEIGSKTERKMQVYKLLCYACYLIV